MMKNIKLFEEFLNETYYNKEWTVTNINGWIADYANSNGLDLKKNETKKFGSKTATSWSMGKYTVIVSMDKAPGAPRLDELLVIIGDPGAHNFNAKNTLSVAEHVGSKAQLFQMFDQKINTK